MRYFLAALVVLIILPATAAEMAPFRAVYELGHLKRSTLAPGSPVTGRVLYRYDRTCEAETFFSQVEMELSGGGGWLRADSEYSIFEALDGRSFRFLIREEKNGVTSAEIEGRAVRPSVDAPADVTYEKRIGAKGEAVESLPPGTFFPLQHTRAVVEAALAGAVLHNAGLFDGSELSLVDSTILPARAPVRESELLPPEMAEMPSWLVRVSFYSPDSDALPPDYATQMRLWRNGVNGDFTMETEILASQARLTELEIFAMPDCD